MYCECEVYCVWDVYMSLRPQAGIKEGARMAANGDEASMIALAG